MFPGVFHCKIHLTLKRPSAGYPYPDNAIENRVLSGSILTVEDPTIYSCWPFEVEIEKRKIVKDNRILLFMNFSEILINKSVYIIAIPERLYLTFDIIVQHFRATAISTFI